MIPLAPAGIPIGIHSGYQISRQDSYWNPPGYRWAITREKPAEKLLSQLGKFCKHSVWISTTHFGGEPQTPEATQMLQSSQICAPSIDLLVSSVLS